MVVVPPGNTIIEEPVRATGLVCFTRMVPSCPQTLLSKIYVQFVFLADILSFSKQSFDQPDDIQKDICIVDLVGQDVVVKGDSVVKIR